MKIVDCKQGSPEWLAARLGIPTASNFDRIVTAKTFKASAQQAGYAAQLMAEWFLRTPLDDTGTAFMERGTEMEPEAAKWYAWQHDADPREVGFCLTDDETAGASPDRLIGDEGLLEIKCPGAVKAMAYYLAGGTDEYAMQIQGQLWVTRRKWCDLLLYNPTIPCVVRRYTPDPAIQAALDSEMPKFCAIIAAHRKELEPLRPPPVSVVADDTGF